ncbi:hypothetical protein [Sinomonas susongensis]|uniref:hypothetical protein n=1 Tax=Sinomonas susongensis TaxID=1324851 RepID=UPI001107C08F|nr:hypothetical protein [Sinomonas susongensis]
MSTIAGQRSPSATHVRKHAWTLSAPPERNTVHPAQPARSALMRFRAAWRRGGEMSQIVDGLRDAAWSASGNASHRFW